MPTDCLLSAAQMSELTAVEMGDGIDTDISNPDGSVGRSCKYYAAAGGVLSFTAQIKVQAPQTGAITDSMLDEIGDEGATRVPGVGRIMVLEPESPPVPMSVMRVANDTYLANVVLVRSNIPESPDVAAWTRAASEILAALPR